VQNAAFAGARVAVALVLAALIGGAGGCNGCKGCTSTGPSAAPKASAASGEHQEQPLVRALDGLEIVPEQSARIHAVKAALEAQNKIVKQARADLSLALAAQVRKNAIDRDALAPQIEAVKKATRATQVGMQRAFDDLHRTLDASQRKALLLSMKRELGQRSNAGRGEGRFRMDEVGTEIGLSSDQISNIRGRIKARFEKLPPIDAAHDHKPIGQQLHAFTVAFESDTFDGSSFDLGGGDTEAIAERGAELLIASAEAALPELTPEQRTKLADKFVERAHKLD
jgi:Spy/CpxP family protein refolding chaperone